MAEPPRFLVGAVRFDSDRHRIALVEICEDFGLSVGAPFRWRRRDVVFALAHGASACIVREPGTGRWQRGAPIHIIAVDGDQYLRIDHAKTPADDLGLLPTF